jgi:hypothetical protein
MACDGDCTFQEIVEYEVDGADNLINLTWRSTRAHTKDCLEDIKDGKGWFKFQRNNDAAVQTVTRKKIIAADKAGRGRSPISGNPLPPGLSVGATRTDFISVVVTLNGGASFNMVDLFFSHHTTCSCAGKTNDQECIVRFSYDATRPAKQKIKHVGGSKIVGPRAGGAGGKKVTYTWTCKEECKDAGLDITYYHLLALYDLLCEKISAAGKKASADDRRHKRLLEKQFKAFDKQFKNESLASLTPGGLFGREQNDELASLVEELRETIQAGDMDTALVTVDLLAEQTALIDEAGNGESDNDNESPIDDDTCKGN